MEAPAPEELRCGHTVQAVAPTPEKVSAAQGAGAPLAAQKKPDGQREQEKVLAFQVRPAVQRGDAVREVQAGPLAGGGSQPPAAPHELGKSTEPAVEEMVKAALAAHAAMLKPWQESVEGIQDIPEAHRVAESGMLGADDALPPARATSHEAHVGAAVMPSADAVPR